MIIFVQQNCAFKTGHFNPQNRRKSFFNEETLSRQWSITTILCTVTTGGFAKCGLAN